MIYYHDDGTDYLFKWFNTHRFNRRTCIYFHSLEIKHHAFSNPVSVKRTYIEPKFAFVHVLIFHCINRSNAREKAMNSLNFHGIDSSTGPWKHHDFAFWCRKISVGKLITSVPWKCRKFFFFCTIPWKKFSWVISRGFQVAHCHGLFIKNSRSVFHGNISRCTVKTSWKGSEKGPLFTTFSRYFHDKYF